MADWARHGVFYHIVTDRFATAKQHFAHTRSTNYSQQLGEWMGGTLQGITASLDYLQELGVDVLVLTPFFRGEKYHGYWTTDYLEIDPHLGTPHCLRALIQSAHQRGMRIIMDIPMTHCHRSAAIAQPSMLCYDTQGTVQGFFGDASLPEFNLESPRVIHYFKTVFRYWLEFGFDGIRFDHAKRPPPGFWRNISRYLQREYPHVLLLAENWNASATIGALATYLHAELNIPVALLLRELVRKPDKSVMQRLIRQIQQQHHYRREGYLLPAFLDNHDMERIALLANADQAVLAMVYLLLFTLPYPPMLYYGSERAQSQSRNLPANIYERDRHFREPMQWQHGATLAGWIKTLSAFRRQHIDWLTGEPEFLPVTDTLLAYRYHHNNETLTIMINFGHQPARLDLAAAPTQLWQAPDMTTRSTVAHATRLDLMPLTAAIMTSNTPDHPQLVVFG